LKLYPARRTDSGAANQQQQQQQPKVSKWSRLLGILWSLLILLRVDLFAVYGKGTGKNLYSFSALDVVGHSTISAMRIRNFSSDSIKTFRTGLMFVGIPGEAYKHVERKSNTDSPFDSLNSFISFIPNVKTCTEESQQWVKNLEKEPRIIDLLRERERNPPLEARILPLCAIIIVASALIAMILPKEAALGVVIGICAVNVLLARLEPTSFRLQGGSFTVFLFAVLSHFI
jgi:hypothetical protein